MPPLVIILTIILSLFHAIGFIIFLKIRHHDLIQHRMPGIVLANILIFICYGWLYFQVVCGFYFPLYVESPSCFVSMWTQYLTTPFWFFSNIIRCACFIQTFTSQEQQRQQDRILCSQVLKSQELLSQNLPSPVILPRLPAITDCSKGQVDPKNRASRFSNLSMKLALRFIKFLVFIENHTPLILLRIIDRKNWDKLAPLYSQRKMTRFTRFGMVYTSILVIMIELVFIAIQYGIAILRDGRSFDSVGCNDPNYNDFALFELIAFLYTVFVPFFLKATLSFKDDISIRKELMIVIPIYYPFFGMFLVQKYAIPSSNILNQYIPPEMWILLVMLLTFALVIYFPGILYYRCIMNCPLGKNHKNRDTKGRASISSTPLKLSPREALLQIFSHEDQLELLKDVATKQLCIENILFVEEYLRLSLGQLRATCYDGLITAGNTSSVSIQPEERIKLSQMYQRFIVPGAPEEINLPNSITHSIHSKMNLNQLTISDLNEAYNHIIDLITMTTYEMNKLRFKAFFSRQT